jgi:hypothetical protein
MKTETILRSIQAIQAKACKAKVKLDEEMNELYFMLDDLYSKIEDSSKKK